jgi:hypothetical protein
MPEPSTASCRRYFGVRRYVGAEMSAVIFYLPAK